MTMQRMNMPTATSTSTKYKATTDQTYYAVLKPYRLSFSLSCFLLFQQNIKHRRARHGASWNLDNTDWRNHRDHGGKIEKRWHLVQFELRPTGCQGEAEDVIKVRTGSPPPVKEKKVHGDAACISGNQVTRDLADRSESASRDSLVTGARTRQNLNTSAVNNNPEDGSIRAVTRHSGMARDNWQPIVSRSTSNQWLETRDFIVRKYLNLVLSHGDKKDHVHGEQDFVCSQVRSEKRCQIVLNLIQFNPILNLRADNCYRQANFVQDTTQS
ncbi:unnamed protein product [Heterotrigona itama]|uniref:Uncharacterized protein n=1 Tax=Heterotrigona itama TaxID=395501 RepID=A0A6V7H1H1_9HYME|nr:unnamed protein product [Heterotrigona itama]